MNNNCIPRQSFLSKDVTFIAQFLLGKYILSNIEGKECVGKIVETEAYRAPDDKGSHAYANKLTDRTRTMFQRGGIAYIYLCYGLHNMLNVVTANEGIAHAILIRALQPIKGTDIMIQRRGTKRLQNLCNGPGKLCSALGITRALNEIDLCDAKSELVLLDNETIPESQIISGPRVGISYAEECAYWPWRFMIKNNSWVSSPAKVIYNH